ncbi:hypothetical protein JV16_01619 [Anoxybacillus ayderensis]|uniref:Uncharacterized protein n=1 Tax=Anoxybacillus ayderensis TaxID=265546 RepID=A0A0D0G6V1_9BACL|nr:hypothetical protein [Anoxybacillus ayderensis]KIP21125.1 hypothetical protein JV16_01619 [Anoxybacillus ayderensis]
MQIIRETATHIQKWDSESKRVVMERKEEMAEKKPAQNKATTKSKVADK